MERTNMTYDREESAMNKKKIRQKGFVIFFLQMSILGNFPLSTLENLSPFCPGEASIFLSCQTFTLLQYTRILHFSISENSLPWKTFNFLYTFTF
jgi:hypothetical protein